jgi:hypothetical protein
MSQEILISEALVDAIMGNHSFATDGYVRFVTDQTTGHIPINHFDTYLNTGLFVAAENEGETVLRFAHDVQGFDKKTNAMIVAKEALFKDGILEQVDVPHFQERAVGGHNRLEQPEFKIDRAYYRSFGFPSDAIFMNVFTGAAEEPKVLLQKRADRVEFGSTFDFAAGGAVKFPQTLKSALNAQITEEIGVSLDRIIYDGSVNFKFSDLKKEWVTNQTHNIFHTFVAERDIKIGDYDQNEVQGFEIVTVDDAVKKCALGQFNRQNTQAFITSLVCNDLLPEFEGIEKVKELVKRHFMPSTTEQYSSFDYPLNEGLDI